MFNTLKKISVSILIVFVSSTACVAEGFSERLELNGFGRIVGGYLDTNEATFQEYSNNVTFSEQSLIAVQADFKMTDTLSVSGQLLAHSSSERESGVEWLYLSYKPTKNLSFKLGKLRTPFFRYSETIDVGFAYPWISPPTQVYGGFLFSNYEGLAATYAFSLGKTNFDAEIYHGVFEGEITRDNERVDFEADAIQGFIFSLNRGNFTARVSATQSSDFFADVPEFNQFSATLDMLGFSESADSLRFDGSVTGYQASMNYDTLDYFLAAELSKIDSDLLVVPNVDAYYLTAGYNFSPFQIHATYSSSHSKSKSGVDEIPQGLSPQLDSLAFVYQQITGNLPDFDLNSITIGTRWDFRYNMAVKAEITFLKGEPGENSFFADFTNPDFDRKATLYQVGLEWVF